MERNLPRRSRNLGKIYNIVVCNRIEVIESNTFIQFILTKFEIRI